MTRPQPLWTFTFPPIYRLNSAMKHFLITSEFLKPFEQFGDVVPQHRAYLQTWYDRGAVLCSGPRADKKGGVIWARAEAVAKIDELLAGDPYQRLGLARYSVVEFVPAKRQALLDGWVEGR